MSVVLMRMVPARMAGVTFTVDPAGQDGLMRIEAVTGLADGLVSGERTPRIWLPPRDPDVETDTEPASPMLSELVVLGRNVERLLGSPQDIEWAWDGRRTWLVQSRPITTDRSGDGCDSTIDDAELMSTGVDEMLPGVLPPLIWDLNAFLVDEALRRVFDDLGVNPPDRTGANAIVRRVRGRAALNLDLFKDAAAALPDVSELDLEHEYFGTAAGVPQATRRRRWAIRRDLRVFGARQRAVVEAETALVAVSELNDADLSPADFDDDGLLGYRARLIDLSARAMAAELAVAAVAAASYRRLERFLARYFDDADAATATQQLTTGTGANVTAAPRASRSVFAGRTWSESGHIPAASSSEPAWPDRAVDRRRMRLEIESRLRRHPRWRRNRALTGQIIDVQMRSLRAAVVDTTTALARREKVKAAVLLLGGLVRSAHLELGRRLCERGQLEVPGEVDLLRDAELRDAVAGNRPARGVLMQRSRWQDRYERAGQLPQRFVGVPPAATAPERSGDVLRGWPASAGRYTGRARTLAAPLVHALDAGDVLVASATDSAWTPVFSLAGAIVVERGGPLSHAAVVARELGVPAVLNVAGAAKHLDGKIVTVDGDRGWVVIDDDPGEVVAHDQPGEAVQVGGEPT